MADYRGIFIVMHCQKRHKKADIAGGWFLWYTILWTTDWCTILMQKSHYPCVLSKILGFLWLRIVKNGMEKADIAADMSIVHFEMNHASVTIVIT